MNHYFITGLPRSRTTWLANLLTTGGSFCYHDALQHGLSLEGVQATFRHIEQNNPKLNSIGDSDSGLLVFYQHFQKAYPSAHWLLIKNNPVTAMQSYKRHFGAHDPYVGMAEVDLPKMFDFLSRQYNDAKNRIRRYLEVDVSDLDNEVVIRRIWKWLIPDEPFNHDRWCLLDKIQMNPFATKIKVELKEAA